LSNAAPTPLLRSKLFWVALLYFSEGFPLGIFYDIFPVWFRQQGVELRNIGLISLLGLAWTFKFLWAPAIDHYRRHRLWMAAVDVLMGAVMLTFAITEGLPLWVWVGIALFTVFSATNDIAIDGYTIELLNRDEMGLANGVRIGFYRVGMLAAGVILILSDLLGWSGAFACAGLTFVACAAGCLAAPKENTVAAATGISLRGELSAISRAPQTLAGQPRHALVERQPAVLDLRLGPRAGDLRRSSARQRHAPCTGGRHAGRCDARPDVRRADGPAQAPGYRAGAGVHPHFQTR
jgi:PAT family beta-lactamase induction signal transducer AmpG